MNYKNIKLTLLIKKLLYSIYSKREIKFNYIKTLFIIIKSYPLNSTIIIISLIISFYSFWFFLDNKIYLIGSDAFYYMSIADSILQYGEMKDITNRL